MVELSQVSNASIAGMICSLLICFGVPIVMMSIGRARYNGKVRDALLGAVAYFLSVFVLQNMLNTIVYMASDGVVESNPWLNALYAAFAAMFFEETTRLIIVKKSKPENYLNGNTFMLGVGFGGFQAVVMVGIFQISNIATSFSINSGQIQSSFERMDEAQLSKYLESLTVLWDTPSIDFFIAGMEQVFIILVEVCFTFLIMWSVKYKKKRLLVGAYIIHFLMIFAATITGLLVGDILECGILLAFCIFVMFYVQSYYIKLVKE